MFLIIDLIIINCILIMSISNTYYLSIYLCLWFCQSINVSIIISKISTDKIQHQSQYLSCRANLQRKDTWHIPRTVDSRAALNPFIRTLKEAKIKRIRNTELKKWALSTDPDILELMDPIPDPIDLDMVPYL